MKSVEMFISMGKIVTKNLKNKRMTKGIASIFTRALYGIRMDVSKLCVAHISKALGAEVAKEKVAHHAMLTQSY